jgi:hypothetical protein
LGSIGDRKLKGRLKHGERLLNEAARGAAKIGAWLAPAEAGSLEAEGEGVFCVCVLFVGCGWLWLSFLLPVAHTRTIVLPFSHLQQTHM